MTECECNIGNSAHLATVDGVFEERIEEEVGKIGVSRISFLNIAEEAAAREEPIFRHKLAKIKYRF